MPISLGSGELIIANIAAPPTSVSVPVAGATGTFSSASASAAIKKVGTHVEGDVKVTITLNGTAQTAVNVTLPDANGSSVDATCAGRNDTTGAALTGIVLAGSSTLQIQNSYPVGYPGADNTILVVHFSYDAAS